MKRQRAWGAFYDGSFLFLCTLSTLLIIRACFFWVNRNELFGKISLGELSWVLWYGIRSDMVVALLIVLPVTLASVLLNSRSFYRLRRPLLAYYVVLMFVVALISIVDIVYYDSNGRRLAMADFYYLRDNIGLLPAFVKIFWWLLLLLLVLMACVYRLGVKWFQRAQSLAYSRRLNLFPSRLIYFGLLLLLSFDFNTGYFFTPSSGYFVVNGSYVPFSTNTMTELVASRRYKPLDLQRWRFMPDEKAFASHPVIHTVRNTQPNKKNIVVFIIESASQEDFLENSQRRTTMPFLDSLMKQSLAFDNFYANGLSSPSGFDAIIGGIPEGASGDFFLSGHGYNHTQWFTQELKNLHYSTWFYYGVTDFSESFLKSSKNFQLDNDFGYRKYHAARNDMDYYYGIYDHVFFPVIAQQMKKVDTPFAAVIYNVSTHAPFNLLPQAVLDTLPEFSKSNGRSLRYYDNVVRKFFSSIRGQRWFSNTIFLFVADHFSRAPDRSDKTAIGAFHIPMFIYSPAPGFKGHYPGVAQQIDIPLALLELTGTGSRFFSYGNNLFDSSARNTIFNKWGDLLQAIDDDYLLQYNFATRQVLGYYRYKIDTALKTNLYMTEKAQADSMLVKLQAFWQVYALTIAENKMHPDKFYVK